MAGNKADLSNSRVVEYEEAKQYAEENGLLFMETSAKTAMNVNDIFLAIGMLIFFIYNCNYTYYLIRLIYRSKKSINIKETYIEIHIAICLL